MLALVTAVVVAAAPVKLAAPGFVAVDVPEKLAAYFSENFATQLALQELTVMTPADLSQVLGLQRQKQLLGCVDDGSCVAELASALGVDGLVVGTLARIGNSYQLNLKVIAASNAAALALWSTRASDEETLLASLRRAGPEVAREVRIALHREVMSQGAALRGPSLVAPLVTGGAGLAATVAGAVLLGLSAQHLSVLQSGAGLPPETSVLAYRDEGKLQRGLGVGLLSAGGAALVSGLLWAVFRMQATPLVWLGPEGPMFALAWRLP